MKVQSNNSYAFYQKEALQTAASTTVLTLLAAVVIKKVMTSRAPKEGPAPKVWTGRVRLGLGVFALATLGISSAFFRPFVNRKAFLDTLFLEGYASVDKENNKDDYLELIRLEAKHNPRGAMAKVRELSDGDRKAIAEDVVVPIGAVDLDHAYELLKLVPSTYKNFQTINSSFVALLKGLAKYDFRRCCSFLDGFQCYNGDKEYSFRCLLGEIPKEKRKEVYNYSQEGSAERIQSIFEAFGKDDYSRAFPYAKKLLGDKKEAAFTGLMPHMLKKEGLYKVFDIVKNNTESSKDVVQALYEEAFNQGLLPLEGGDPFCNLFGNTFRKIDKDYALEQLEKSCTEGSFFDVDYKYQRRIAIEFLQERVQGDPQGVMRAMTDILREGYIEESFEFVEKNHKFLRSSLNNGYFYCLFDEDIQKAWKLYDLLQDQDTKAEALVSNKEWCLKDIKGFLKRAEALDASDLRNKVLERIRSCLFAVDPAAAARIPLIEVPGENEFYCWLFSTAFPSHSFSDKAKYRALEWYMHYVATKDLEEGKKLAKHHGVASNIFCKESATIQEVQEVWDNKLMDVIISPDYRIERNPKLCEHFLSLIINPKKGVEARLELLKNLLDPDTPLGF